MKIIRQHTMALLGLFGLASHSFVNYAICNRVGFGGVFGRRIYASIAGMLGWKAYLIVSDTRIRKETVGVARGVIHCDHPSIVTYPGDSLYCLGRASAALKPSYKWEDDGTLVNEREEDVPLGFR